MKKTILILTFVLFSIVCAAQGITRSVYKAIIQKEKKGVNVFSDKTDIADGSGTIVMKGNVVSVSVNDYNEVFYCSRTQAKEEKENEKSYYFTAKDSEGLSCEMMIYYTNDESQLLIVYTSGDDATYIVFFYR